MVCVGATLEDFPIDGTATKDHPLAIYIVAIRKALLKLLGIPPTPESEAALTSVCKNLGLEPHTTYEGKVVAIHTAFLNQVQLQAHNINLTSGLNHMVGDFRRKLQPYLGCLREALEKMK